MAPVFSVASAVLALAALCSASPGRVRGSGKGVGGSTSDRRVSAQEVETSLHASLEAVLQGGNAVSAKQLTRIEARMWRTFQALPKNTLGRLAPRAVRYIVNGYFAKEHGWIINGLEPHGLQPNVSEVHEVSILQEKAPAFVEALLENRRVDAGLSLSDVVVMAAVLERLIFDESIALLQAAYTLNDLTVVDQVDEQAIHEVLTSYLMIFEMGIRGNVTDVRRHQAIKNVVANAGGSWPLLVEFEQDAVLNFDYESYHQRNPFVARRYSFEQSSKIVESLAQDYGKWQNTECRQMREELMGLDPDGSGRVALKAFYSQPETADYQFSESADYLRKIGALDETSGASGPSVRIANYMAGPSNCIAKSTYYSVCCLSDCEGIMNELEDKVQAPAASPERLLAAVGNLSSSSAEQQISTAMAEERLRAIAGRNGGEVPLHGRLFAEFLHYAFPLDCPYPHVAEDAAVLTPGHWKDKKATALEEERQLHIQTADAKEAAAPAPPLVIEWSEEEVLPVLEPPRGDRAAWTGALRAAVQLAMLLAALRATLTGLRVAAGTARGGAGAGKEKGFVLPVHL